MRHRLQWFIHLRAQGLSKEDEHPTNTRSGVLYFLPSSKAAAWLTDSGLVLINKVILRQARLVWDG